MGVKVVQKKEQVFIAYSAGNDRRLFAVKPTIKCLKCQIDLENRIVNTGRKQYDRVSTEALQNTFNWFVSTVERLEKFEKRIASVSVIGNLYEDEFVNSRSSEGIKNLDFWINYNNFMAYKKTHVKPSTFQQYNEIERRRLERFFERQEFRYNSIDQIDNIFLIRFNEYFIKEKPLGAASYTHLVSVFKNFVKYLISMKLLTADRYEIVKYHLKSKEYENSKDIALTLKELNLLYSFNDLTPAVKRNLDYFICNCLLGGLRWSDFKALTFDEINMVTQRVELFSRKTQKQLSFPIFDLCFKIIKKYNPEVYDTEQRVFKELNNLNVFNRTLKQAAHAFYIINKNGEREYPYQKTKPWVIQNVNSVKSGKKPLSDFFKASMARRTFITIMRRAGFGFEETKVFTGHANPITYSRYSKVNEEDQKFILEKAFGGLLESENISHLRIAN